MAQFDRKAFNKTVGEVLCRARTRAHLSRKEVCKNISNFSDRALADVEKGELSIPCYILYKLLVMYGLKEEEVLLFQSPRIDLGWSKKET